MYVVVQYNESRVEHFCAPIGAFTLKKEAQAACQASAQMFLNVSPPWYKEMRRVQKVTNDRYIITHIYEKKNKSQVVFCVFWLRRYNLVHRNGLIEVDFVLKKGGPEMISIPTSRSSSSGSASGSLSRSRSRSSSPSSSFSGDEMEDEEEQEAPSLKRQQRCYNGLNKLLEDGEEEKEDGNEEEKETDDPLNAYYSSTAFAAPMTYYRPGQQQRAERKVERKTERKTEHKRQAKRKDIEKEFWAAAVIGGAGAEQTKSENTVEKAIAKRKQFNAEVYRRYHLHEERKVHVSAIYALVDVPLCPYNLKNFEKLFWPAPRFS